MSKVGKKLRFKKMLVQKTKDESFSYTPGRYPLSQLWGIKEGYMTPGEYVEGEDYDFTSAYNIWNGVAKHSMLEDLFGKYDYNVEEKKVKEIEVNGSKFEIVGKADIQDLVDDESVEDFKTSVNLIEGKPWSNYQVKIYCTVFEKPKGYILQPRIKKVKGKVVDAWLEVLSEVERDDDWFNKQMEELEKFHCKVMNYIENKNE